MNLKEKRDLVHNYCRKTRCSECVLNDEKHGWVRCHKHSYAIVKCLTIDEADEEDLDKAIALIEEQEKTINDVRVANGFPPLKADDLGKFVINYDDNVNSPSHYTDGKIEVIEYIEDKKLGFCLGNAIKYISRAGKKDKDKESEDIKKAIWYLNRYLKEIEEV